MPAPLAGLVKSSESWAAGEDSGAPRSFWHRARSRLGLVASELPARIESEEPVSLASRAFCRRRSAQDHAIASGPPSPSLRSPKHHPQRVASSAAAARFSVGPAGEGSAATSLRSLQGRNEPGYRGRVTGLRQISQASPDLGSARLGLRRPRTWPRPRGGQCMIWEHVTGLDRGPTGSRMALACCSGDARTPRHGLKVLNRNSISCPMTARMS